MEYSERDVDGVPIRWLESGDGFPVVFVHGIPTSPHLWRYVIPKVRGARCLAFEMVGYGSSIPAGRNRDISVAKQADYLLAWLAALGIDRAVLVGHDLGGGVVQIAAVRDPARCAGIVLTNVISRDSWPILLARVVARGRALVGRTPMGLFKRTIAPSLRPFHDTWAQAREAAAVHGRYYVEHDGAAALARQMASLRTEDTLAIGDRLSTLSVPARVVWGTGDNFQPVHYGDLLASDFGIRVDRIEGARHFTPEDHPDRIAAAVNAVLAKAQA